MLGFLFGFIGGIAFGSFFHIEFWFIFVFLFITSIVFVYRFFVDEENKKILTTILFVMLGIFLGLSRIFISDLYSDSH